MSVCNHIYKYIATERVPTDQWHYAERIYVNEIIVYCLLCQRHIRLSEEEWERYKEERYKEYCNKHPKDNNCLIKFDKKVVSFSCENALINLDIITNTYKERDKT